MKHFDMGFDELSNKILADFHRSVQPQSGFTEFTSISKIPDARVQSLTSLLAAMAKQGHQEMFDRSTYLKKIWFQSTTTNSQDSFDPGSSPFKPHLDVNRMWKGMYFVEDVGIDDGPFMSSELNPNDFEKIRLEAKRLVKSGRAPQEIYGDHLSEIQLFPQTGPAGTMLVFDTNTPHQAGTPKPNHSRRVIRLDFSVRRFL